MKKISILFIGFILTFGVEGQDLTSFRLYSHDLKILNPAFAGTENEQQFNFLHKTFWSKLEESPTSFLLSYENHLEKINSGIGFLLENERIGGDFQFGLIDMRLLYNYHIKINRKEKIVFGTGFHYKSANSMQIDYSGPSGLGSMNASYSTIDFDLGAAYHSKNTSVGLSTGNVLNSNLIDELASVSNVRAYRAFVTYKYNLSRDIEVTSLIAYAYQNTQRVWDINLNSVLGEVVLLGINYQIKEGPNSIAYLAGITIENSFKVLGSFYSNPNKFRGISYELALFINISNE